MEAEARSATLRTGQDHGLADAEASARESIEALRAARAPLLAASFRLHLRFPDTDPIIGELAEWREIFELLPETYQAALDSGDVEMAELFGAAEETAKSLGEQLKQLPRGGAGVGRRVRPLIPTNAISGPATWSAVDWYWPAAP